MITNRFFRTSVGRKSIMAASGAFLSLFLLVHGLGNATTFFGRGAFLAYASRLHSLGGLITVFEFLLLALFLLHIIIGLQLFIENISARPNRYKMSRASGGRTLGSRSMPYSGLLVLLFLIMHLGHFHFTDHSRNAADIIRALFAMPLYASLYAAGLVILFFHISHGFWSLLQSVGINHPLWNGPLRRMTLALAVILVAVFLFIPLSTLLVDSFLL